MPGLSGQVSAVEPIGDPEGVLAALESVQALPGLDLIPRRYASRHCVLSNVLTGILRANLEQPAVDPAGRGALVLEGEVFNLEELARGLDDVRAGPPAELLLRLFLERGTGLVDRLDGGFNIAFYETGPGRLTILNDRFGSKPLYYLEEPGALLFGSEKKSILAIARRPPAVDPLGVLQVFAFRHNLGGRTFLEGLRALPPGARLAYGGGRLTVARYRRLATARLALGERSRVPARQLVEEGAAILAKAARRRLEGKSRVLVNLSGGLDSRAVACAIPRELRPIWARTRGFAGSADARCASEISARLGFRHYREDPSDVPFSRVLSKIVWRTEAAVIFANCTTITSHSSMKEKGDFITGGYFGDISSGAHIYPYMFLPGGRGRFLERAYARYTVYPPEALARVFRRELLEAQAPILRESFLQSFSEIEERSNIRAHQIWELTERQTRMTICASPVDSHLFETCYLMSDSDYMDFCLSLDLRYRYGRSLYGAIIHRLGPEIRDIPNGNTGLPLRPSVLGNAWNHLRAQAGNTSAALVRTALPSFRKEQMRVHREGITRMTRDDPGFRRILEGFLRSDRLDEDIFDRRSIEETLEAHLCGAADHAHLLCLLATFAAGFSFFVGTRPASPPAEVGTWP